MLLGAPTLKLRGDYLAIVTLGFGEIIRVFLNNLEYAGQRDQRPEAASASIDDFLTSSGWSLGKSWEVFMGLHAALKVTNCTTTSSSLLVVIAVLVVCYRLENSAASAAPGWPSARTRSPPRPWASTPAT